MFLGALVAIGLLTAATANAATTVRVDADGDAGWDFNPDPANATPYHFTTDEASIGSGSLYVEQISATDAPRKFIGGLGIGVPVADVESFSFDFLIGAGGDPTDASKFYINVYATVDNSNFFYDCRYDYVATSGSNSEWSTVTADADTIPTFVARRSSPRPETPLPCPTTLADMPEGSYVRAIAINVGDTTLTDANLDGYVDNVVVTLTSGVTIYDFEASPASQGECKKGGWEAFGFKNQGDCIQFVNTNK